MINSTRFLSLRLLSALLLALLLAATCDAFKLRTRMEYLPSSPLIKEGRVFPESSLYNGNAAAWRTLGNADGNRLGVRVASDPGGSGAVTEFWFNATNLKRRWLTWEMKFPAAIERNSIGGFAFELYPPTDVPANITFQLGLPLAIKDIGPAYQRSIGAVEAGRWNRIEVVRGSDRHPYAGGIRVVLDISREGVPLEREVRFLVKNFTLLPNAAGGRMQTKPLSLPAQTGGAVEAAWVQVDSSTELSSGEPFEMSADVALGSEKALRAQLEVVVQKDGSDTASREVSEVVLFPPVSRINLSVVPTANAQGVIESGGYSVSMQLLPVAEAGTAAESGTVAEVGTAAGVGAVAEVGAAGGGASAAGSAALLRTERAAQFTWFDSAHWQARLSGARARLDALKDKAAALQQRAILVDEPLITLTVAGLFLDDYLNDDYERQNERRIAHTLLDQVLGLLDRAESELNARAAGQYREQPLPYRYDAAAPLEIRDGRFYQGDAPVLLFGPQEHSALRALPYAHALGFNALLLESDQWVLRTPDKRYLAKAVARAADEGLAVFILASTHYLQDMPSGAHASHVMMPYDILSPDTRPRLEQFYKGYLAPLRGLENLVSIGLANEPGYAIGAQAEPYEAALQQWLGKRYSESTQALNTRWGSAYNAFSEITLREVFRNKGENPAISYDWEVFRAEVLGDHFAFMRDAVISQLPQARTWVKKYHTLGFGQIDPEVLLDQSEDINGWSSNSSPFYTDWARGMDPQVPITITEWKLVPGFTVDTLDAAPEQSALRIFENYARGVSSGIIWKWDRRAWRAMGDHHTFTRYPTAMDTIGRASLRLQQLAPAFARLGELGDGAVALLFDKASLLHQGGGYETDPVTGFTALYWQLNRNSGGVRVLHAGRASAEDIAPRKLIAAGTAASLDADLMQILYDWVSAGGTLWLTAPGALATDPWGKAYAGDVAFAGLVAAAAHSGEHPLGKGRVVVDPHWQGCAAFLDGPSAYVADSNEPLIHAVECRYLPADKAAGKPGYFYILNREATPQAVQLRDGGGDGQPWAVPASARELWQAAQEPDARIGKSAFTLQPYEVLLFEFNE